MKINAGFLPLPAHGTFRYALHGGDFGEGEAGKEFQVDNLNERRVGLGKLVQCIADLGQLSFIDGVFHRLVAQGGNFELPAAFHCAAAPRVIDDQPSHCTGGIGHKASLVGKRRASPGSEVKIGFVEETRGTYARRAPDPCQFAPSQAVQLGVECGEQLLCGRSVALFGGRNQRWNSIFHLTNPQLFLRISAR
jgi:hypothetical protein